MLDPSPAMHALVTFVMPSPVRQVLLPLSIPSPSQGVWYIGPIPVRAYALCTLAGIFLAVWWTQRRYKERGGDPDVTFDVALVGVPAGIVGARLYHVLSSPDAYFGPNGDLTLIPQIWHGGQSIWGAIPAGVAAGAWWLHRKGLRLTVFADAVAPTFLVAQAVGRLGNWFNQEIFGGPTTLPWGLEIDDAHMPYAYPHGTLFHPTFLYEALWNLAGAAFLIWLEKRLRSRDGVVGGRLVWAYVMVYTSGRAWIECLRVDEAHVVAGLRLNVWTSILFFILGAVGYVLTSRRHCDDSVTVGATSDPEPLVSQDDLSDQEDAAASDTQAGTGSRASADDDPHGGDTDAVTVPAPGAREDGPNRETD